MRYTKRLLALSLAALLACVSTAVAEGQSSFSGSMEAGAAGVGISDSAKRVNEYSVIRPRQGAEAYGKVDLTGVNNGIAVDVKADYMGSRDQKYDLGIDIKRILRLNSSYDSFLHWLDHDKIDYLDAGIRRANLTTPGSAAGWVVLSPNSVPPAFNAVAETALGTEVRVVNPPVANTSQQFGRATVYGEDFTKNDDFSIIRREWKNHVDLTFPQLPNITFHAGYRMEEREGTEQSIGMSKCTACHITGQSRKVDEQTEDFTAGATGRFGLLTIDYSYLDRQFREKAAAPVRRYDPTNNPGTDYAPSNTNFDNRITYDYEAGALPYDVIPDSDKESHILKARIDLPRSSIISASLVNSKVESKKTDEPDPNTANAAFGGFIYPKKTIETTYDAYGLKATTKLTKKLTLNARLRYEEQESDDRRVIYQLANTAPTGGLGGAVDLTSLDRVYHSVLSREILTLGFDAIYRLGLKDTLRLSYEFKDLDREDEHFGTTESHTIKADYKTRPTKNLNARVGYTFQHFNRPFEYEDAALYQNPVTGLNYFDKDGNVATSYGDPTTWAVGYILGTGPTYGVEFYDKRVADLSNQPEDVHEGKVALTWSPQANLSATVNLRARFEENDLDHSNWKQQTYSPGLSVWYAPTNNFNLTFAYNYHAQSTESDFCQGWYDG